MWIVYVIQHNATRELYFGCTQDLANRLAEHNAQKRGYTKRDLGIWILVYAEAYRDKHDAYNRESKLKQHGNARHELKKRIAKSLLMKPKVVLDEG